MKFKITIVILLVIFSLMFLSACISSNANADASSLPSNRSDNTKDPEGLDPAIELEMRENYRKHLIPVYGSPNEVDLDSISIQEYFGNFSGCEVVYMGSNLVYTADEPKIEIAGYLIVFNSGQEVYAYKDSQFHTLKEAFDMDLLTKEDIYAIGQKLDRDFLENNPKP